MENIEEPELIEIRFPHIPSGQRVVKRPGQGNPFPSNRFILSVEADARLFHLVGRERHVVLGDVETALRQPLIGHDLGHDLLVPKTHPYIII